MKSQIRALAIAVGLLFSAASFAETPVTTAPAPAATTTAPATTTTAPVTHHVTTHHVTTHTAAPATTAPATHTAAPATTAPATHTAAPAKAKPSAMPTTAAAGGDPSKVWINAKSKTYHCFGTKYYGKTKAGEYLTEADAKAKGYHGIHGKACPSK